MRKEHTPLSATGRGGHRLGKWWREWVVLAVGMLLTISASVSVKVDADSDARREFNFACDEIRLNIVARLTANAGILHSGAALFDASETVERAEWRAFVQSLRIEDQLPGTQGVGFSQWIPRAQ